MTRHCAEFYIFSKPLCSASNLFIFFINLRTSISEENVKHWTDRSSLQGDEATCWSGQIIPLAPSKAGLIPKESVLAC